MQTKKEVSSENEGAQKLPIQITDADNAGNNMTLFIGSNGNGSTHVVLFAPNEKRARELAVEQIKEEELEEEFPSIDFQEYKAKEGVIEIICSLNFI